MTVQAKWRAPLTAIVLGGAALLPLVFARDVADSFRLAKELMLRAEAILIIAAALIAIIAGAPLPKVRFRDPALFVPLSACAVFVLLTLTSTKPELSHAALLTASAALVIYLGTYAAARSGATALIAVPLCCAGANALLVVLEEMRLWMPFGENATLAHHVQCTALIGNPNEVGSYLAIAIVATAAALRTRRTTAVHALLIVLGAGLVASRTLSGIIACAVAVLAMVAMTSWRSAMRAALIAAGAAIVIIVCVAPLRERAEAMATSARAGDYNELVTERLTPFAAAAAMFADHPFTGVGPGAFGWHYYDYKIAAEQRFPSLRRAYNRGVNYGEVHNDHLQVLAEGGLLGYAAFAAALVTLGWFSFGGVEPRTDRERFAKSLAFPLALCCAILALPQFPLESPAIRGLLVHFAAVVAAWRRT